MQFCTLYKQVNRYKGTQCYIHIKFICAIPHPMCFLMAVYFPISKELLSAQKLLKLIQLKDITCVEQRRRSLIPSFDYLDPFFAMFYYSL